MSLWISVSNFKEYLRQINCRFRIQGVYLVFAYILAIEIDRQIGSGKSNCIAFMGIMLPFQGSRAFLEGASNGPWIVMTINVVKKLTIKA
jgi:hypothetical protein